MLGRSARRLREYFEVFVSDGCVDINLLCRTTRRIRVRIPT